MFAECSQKVLSTFYISKELKLWYCSLYSHNKYLDFLHVFILFAQNPWHFINTSYHNLTGVCFHIHVSYVQNQWASLRVKNILYKYLPKKNWNANINFKDITGNKTIFLGLTIFITSFKPSINLMSKDKIDALIYYVNLTNFSQLIPLFDKHTELRLQFRAMGLISLPLAKWTAKNCSFCAVKEQFFVKTAVFCS